MCVLRDSTAAKGELAPASHSLKNDPIVDADAPSDADAEPRGPAKRAVVEVKGRRSSSILHFGV